MVALRGKGDNMGGGDWLDDGDYHVRVKSFRHFACHSGSKGVEVELESVDGSGKTRASFVFAGGGLDRFGWFVAEIASKEIRDEMDTDVQAHFDRLIGRECWVRVELEDSGYHEAKQWWKLGDEPPKQRATPRTPRTPGTPKLPKDGPPASPGDEIQDDDIPF